MTEAKQWGQIRDIVGGRTRAERESGERERERRESGERTRETGRNIETGVKTCAARYLVGWKRAQGKFQHYES